MSSSLFSEPGPGSPGMKGSPFSCRSPVWVGFSAVRDRFQFFSQVPYFLCRLWLVSVDSSLFLISPLYAAWQFPTLLNLHPSYLSAKRGPQASSPAPSPGSGGWIFSDHSHSHLELDSSTSPLIVDVSLRNKYFRPCHLSDSNRYRYETKSVHFSKLPRVLISTFLFFHNILSKLTQKRILFSIMVKFILTRRC